MMELKEEQIGMEVVLLSQHPELLKGSADLLNSQWKRSTSARIQSLEKSLAHLPDSLLLLEKTKNGTEVIGHSRLTRVLEDPFGCWIGSVVIREDKRSKGYGKYIMQKTEEYAKSLQFSTAYLNTHDQEGFYEHLGYSYCNPVSSISFSCNIFIPKNLPVWSSDYENKNNLEQSQDRNICYTNTACTDLKVTETASIPLPPPLPSQCRNKSFSADKIKSNLGQYWMKKIL